MAVPLSLVGTFGVMYLLGYSLNNLTLMALTISTGFVVDDAIVMIENISRYIEEGDSPLEAALKGAEQIGFTIVSLTVSLIAVLIPLLFMGDIVGRLFREFAVTLSRHHPGLRGRLADADADDVRDAAAPPQARASRARFYRCVGARVRADHRALRPHAHVGAAATSRPPCWSPSATLVAHGPALYVVIPKGFFPVQDTGVILGISEAPQSISFPAMAERQQALAHVILKDPAVESLSSFIGIDGTNTTLNSGRIQINLKPLEERTASASDVIRRLQPELAKVEGITLFMQPVQDLTVEDRVSRTQYQYSLEDPDARELDDWVPRFVAKLQDAAGAARRGQRPAERRAAGATLELDRDTASRLGITPQMIDDTLYDAFGQRQISTMFTQLNQYHVVLEVEPELRRSTPGRPAGRLPCARRKRRLQVPLAAVHRHVRSQNARRSSINHQGQFPVVTLSFNLAPGASLGDAVRRSTRAKARLEHARQHPGGVSRVPPRRSRPRWPMSRC